MPFQPFGDLFGGVTRDQKLITYRTLRSDNIFANQIVISGGTKGFIRSENFEDGVSGWALFGDGTAKLFTVALVSDLQGNWDGADPADLSSTHDGAATTGYYFDASAGSAQMMGDFWLGGDLTLIGSGKFATNTAGNKRIEITDNAITFKTASDTTAGYMSVNTSNQMQLSDARLSYPWIIGLMTLEANANLVFVADTSETVYANGGIDNDYSGATGNVSSWRAPYTASYSGYLSVGFIGDKFRLTNGYTVASGSILFQVDRSTGQSQWGNGSASVPSLSFVSDPTTGIYRYSSGAIGFSTGNFLAARMYDDGTNGWLVSDVIQATNEFQATALGSVSDVSFGWTNSGNCGLYQPAATEVAVSANGTMAARFTSAYTYFTNTTGAIAIKTGAGNVGTPALTFVNRGNNGLYSIATNYWAAAAGGVIVQQWGWTGSAKEIYFYGLSSGSTNYVRYNGTSGLLQYSSSTIRIKKDIEPMPVGLTDKMPGGQWYRMRNNDEIDNPPVQRVPTGDGEFEEVPLLVSEEDQGKERGGVIAEWTAAIDERFGIYNDGDDQPINYEMEALVGAILTDLQDSRKRVAQLEAQVAMLLSN